MQLVIHLYITSIRLRSKLMSLKILILQNSLRKILRIIHPISKIKYRLQFFFIPKERKLSWHWYIISFLFFRSEVRPPRVLEEKCGVRRLGVWSVKGGKFFCHFRSRLERIANIFQCSVKFAAKEFMVGCSRLFGARNTSS